MIIPPGFCQCGCGQATTIAKRTRPERGIIAGQPNPYAPSHSSNRLNLNPDEHRERVRKQLAAASMRHYWRHHEAMIEKSREPEQRDYKKRWREMNREELNLRDRERYWNNPEAHRATAKAWREANPNRGAEYRKAWGKTERGISLIIWHRELRRVRTELLGNTLTGQEWLSILRCQGFRCAACQRKFTRQLPPTRDHIVPVILGGALIVDNCQALCQSCNAKKGTRIVDYRSTLPTDIPAQTTLDQQNSRPRFSDTPTPPHQTNGPRLEQMQLHL